MLQRIISALVLAPLVLLIVWAGQPWTTIVVAAAVVISVREISCIFAAAGHHPRRTGYIAALGFLAAAVLDRYSAIDLAGVALAGAALLTLVAELARADRSDSLRSWALTLAGAVYAGWLLCYFILLRDLSAPPLRSHPLSALAIEPGAAWVYLVFAVTWASDTGAYFAGRALGRHHMAPQLSPKKTWEGFAGGLLASVGAGIGMVPLLGLPVSLLAGALLGLLGGIFGTLGDLAESLLKRQAGVKDSGALIPGHGGLLDRIDSMLFTGPVLYYAILLLTS